MKNTLTDVVHNVSDTAWLVATWRAAEGERPDAHFKDPYANTLVGEKGHAIREAFKDLPDMAWFMAVRTTVIDEMVRELVAREGVDLVVNLACGLCTRPYRMELPRSLRWVEVDLAPVIAYKKATLAKAQPHCQVSFRACDLANGIERQAMLKDASFGAKKVLVITEGLLPYLTEQNVADLAKDLSEIAAFWLTDMYDTASLRGDGADWAQMMAEANAALRFSPPQGNDFFPEHGWKVCREKNFLVEAERLNRLPPKTPAGGFAEWPGETNEAYWENSGILLLEKR